MSLPDSEYDERTKLLVDALEKILKAHTDSLSFRDASYVIMRSLARCFALHGLRLTAHVHRTPDPEYTLRKLRGMPWEEAIREMLPVVEAELEQRKMS
jgi:hypothetical protein